MNNIFEEIKTNILQNASKVFGKEILEIESVENKFVVELPKEKSHGDVATNIAMTLTKDLRLPPREIATKLKDILEKESNIEKIEIAGPGFINITFTKGFWHEVLQAIISAGEEYGNNKMGQGQSINIEYVSCNPTGPMHIGHARGAVYGDVIASVLKKCGFKVTKEFYINDAGSQISDLANSVFFRYQDLINNQTSKTINKQNKEIPQEIPKGLYPGEYLIPVAKKLLQTNDKTSGENLTIKDIDKIKQFAVEEMMTLIKSDLKELGVEHDVFFSEKSLHDNNKITEVIEKLKAKQLIYEGILPPPKGKENEHWVEKTQTLFKSTQFGDSQDQALKKGDGTWTYFAAELAYFQDKINRNFDQLVLVLGADHGGHVKRSHAAVKALKPDAKDGMCNIKLCQLVNYVSGGRAIKMSKRSGEFLTVKDILDEVGKDVLRFMMLTRKNEVVIDFDLEEVVEYSKDNPVFYVQYAHVRSLSVINNAKENSHDAYKLFLENKADTSLLNLDPEIEIIKTLALWPKTIESSAKYFEPHRIVFFLQNLASQFHALWNLNYTVNCAEGAESKLDIDYRFIIENNTQLTAARLTLAKSVQQIINQGLQVIGVQPMLRM